MIDKNNITLEDLIKNPYLIAYDMHQTVEKQMEIAKIDGDLLGFMSNPSKEVVLKCIETTPSAVKYAFFIVKPEKIHSFYDAIATDFSVAIEFINDENNLI